MKLNMKSIGGAIIVMSLCSMSLASPLKGNYLGDNWKLKKPTVKNVAMAKAARLQYHWERSLFPDDDTKHLGVNRGSRINYLGLVRTYREVLKKVPCTSQVLFKEGTLIAKKNSSFFDVTEKPTRYGTMVYNPKTGASNRIGYAVTNRYICAVIAN